MATRYKRETGRNWNRFNKPTDPETIQYLSRCRTAPKRSAAWPTYLSIRQRAFQPTLGKLVQAERRIEANAFARSTIAANPSQPFDLHAYAERLFGMAA